MSNRQMSPDLMQSAYSEYSTALLATNRALQDPAMYKSDSTLAAVMLLGMYEVRPFSCTSETWIDRTGDHMSCMWHRSHGSLGEPHQWCDEADGATGIEAIGNTSWTGTILSDTHPDCTF